jgi:hypothetical protein
MTTRVAFALGGDGIDCEFADGLEHAARSFAEPDAASDVSLRGAVLRVVVRHGVETSPASRGFEQTSVFGETKGYSGSGRHELWDGDALVVAELDGSGVRATVGPQTNQHRLGAVMLFAATALALRAHGLFHLHAACVDVPGVGPVVIAGESGSGKTTLSLALASLGGRLLSDDAVFLGRGKAGAVLVSGWPQGLHVARATLEAFPRLAEAAIRSVEDGRDKWVVPARALGRGMTEAFDPKLLLFPSVVHQPATTIAALTPARAATHLVPHGGLWVIPGAAHSTEQLALLAALATRAKAFEIALGTDALGSHESLLTLLERAAHGWRRD